MTYNGYLYKGPNIKCKGCADRYPACHDHCEAYQQALDEWKNHKRQIKRAKHKIKDFESFKIETTLKNRR